LPVIHPGLFLIMQRFPERKDALRRMYRSCESFRSICNSYQQCSEALRHWVKSEHKESPNRQREYSELMQELEQEIIQSLEEGI
jgi:hypothetical protein